MLLQGPRGRPVAAACSILRRWARSSLRAACCRSVLPC